MKTNITVALIAAGLSSTAFAIDQDYSSDTMNSGDVSSPSTFNRLDANKDGVLSKIELNGEPALTEDWARIDANSDGQLDRSEFSMFEANENPGLGADPAVQSDTGGGYLGDN